MTPDSYAEGETMLQRLYRSRLAEVNAWFRGVIAGDLGPRAPKDDADLVTVALAGGYHCEHVIPFAGDHLLRVLRKGQVIASRGFHPFRG